MLVELQEVRQWNKKQNKRSSPLLKKKKEKVKIFAAICLTGDG